MSVCTIIACWFAGSFVTGAIYVAVNLLRQPRQQQPDEHGEVRRHQHGNEVRR